MLRAVVTGGRMVIGAFGLLLVLLAFVYGALSLEAALEPAKYLPDDPIGRTRPAR